MKFTATLEEDERGKDVIAQQEAISYPSLRLQNSADLAHSHPYPQRTLLQDRNLYPSCASVAQRECLWFGGWIYGVDMSVDEHTEEEEEEE
ncbi:hypothetical protein CC2G_009061 [Coprinopsis cinerea AmutBmut pab1-1]|nr:hypothetical protein CC2G_009061 [Coprinopsis cinerea AmutBmut pab1-1]